MNDGAAGREPMILLYLATLLMSKFTIIYVTSVTDSGICNGEMV